MMADHCGSIARIDVREGGWPGSSRVGSLIVVASVKSSRCERGLARSVFRVIMCTASRIADGDASPDVTICET